MRRERRLAKAALAADAWRRLFQFFISTRAQRDRVLSRHGLTPNDIRALSSLASGEGRTMRSLAEEWGCDASNATWIVDRLERRGWARRATPASDRRVKRVGLTPLGERLKRKVFRELNEPPPELVALDVKRLSALRNVLSTLPEPAGESSRFPKRRPESRGRVRSRDQELPAPRARPSPRRIR